MGHIALEDLCCPFPGWASGLTFTFSTQQPCSRQHSPWSACHVCSAPSAAWFATSLHTRPCHRALSTPAHLTGPLADVSDSHAKGGLAAPFQQCPPVHIIGTKHTEAKATASTWHPPAAVHIYVGMCRSIAPTGRALSTSCQHGNLKTSHVHDFHTGLEWCNFDQGHQCGSHAGRCDCIVTTAGSQTTIAPLTDTASWHPWVGQATSALWWAALLSTDMSKRSSQLTAGSSAMQDGNCGKT